MKTPRYTFTIRTIAAGAFFTFLIPATHGTNGMNMEGYGPIATSMGGASMAYDNGTAAVINNPATLGLMPDGSQLDIALGILGPDVVATSPQGEPANSSANAFFMPAFGYINHSGNLSYGIGLFGQGGMGCEYDADSWRGLGFNLANRTEVSVGRLIAPIVWNVNEQLTFAATADFVWAGMDLKMAMTGTQFSDLIDPSMQNFGRASGQLVNTLGGMLQQLPPGTSVDYAYFDYSNGNDFTGAAQGYGYAGKIGMVYEPSPSVTFGATYHTKTRISNLKANGQFLAFQLNVPGMGQMAQTLVGDYTVVDFEWPAMLGGGFAWNATSDLMIVGDLRQVFWEDVMKDFNVRFLSSDAASNGPFASQNLDATLYQDWSDQTVIMIGAAYRVSDKWTIRGGANFGDNPVPDQYLNCLFPAIVEKHITAGAGYQINDRSSINVSLTKGLKATRTSGYDVTVSHSQLNAQMMYSLRF